MNDKTKKRVKNIIIFLVVLVCGVLAIYAAIIGLFSYLDSTVKPTKYELFLTSMGEFTTEEHYRYGWWQDGGTYSKYTYKSADLNNEYLSQITESDIEEIEHNISEFEFWVSSSKDSEKEDDKLLYKNYDFDVSIIDTNDYWFVEYDETAERDFDLFIFDTETNVLYGFSYSI